MSEDAPDAPGFVPGRHQVEAYGRGGFRFAGMSHKGSLLMLPSGVRAWEVAEPDAIRPASLAPAFAETPPLEFLLIGTGLEIAHLPDSFRRRFREAGISLDVMATGAAARTFNVMLAENRRVGAALIAVA